MIQKKQKKARPMTWLQQAVSLSARLAQTLAKLRDWAGTKEDLCLLNRSAEKARYKITRRIWQLRELYSLLTRRGKLAGSDQDTLPESARQADIEELAADLDFSSAAEVDAASLWAIVHLSAPPYASLPCRARL